MIRVSKEADYAIVVLTYFARNPKETMHTARTIAQKIRVSKPMVSKILKILAHSGLLTSHRGIKGGYVMAKRADEITVEEIIRAVEGPLSMTECTTEEHGTCKMEEWCPLTSPWQVVNRAVRDKLKTIKLSVMAQPLGLALPQMEKELKHG